MIPRASGFMTGSSFRGAWPAITVAIVGPFRRRQINILRRLLFRLYMYPRWRILIDGPGNIRRTSPAVVAAGIDRAWFPQDPPSVQRPPSRFLNFVTGRWDAAIRRWRRRGTVRSTSMALIRASPKGYDDQVGERGPENYRAARSNRASPSGARNVYQKAPGPSCAGLRATRHSGKSHRAWKFKRRWKGAGCPRTATSLGCGIGCTTICRR